MSKLTVEEMKSVLEMAKKILSAVDELSNLGDEARDFVISRIEHLVVPQELISISEILAELIIDEDECPTKHKHIGLTEFKNLFPAYKITRNILKDYAQNGSTSLILDGIEIDIRSHGKGIYADFVKDNYIHHLSC